MMGFKKNIVVGFKTGLVLIPGGLFVSLLSKLFIPTEFAEFKLGLFIILIVLAILGLSINGWFINKFKKWIFK